MPGLRTLSRRSFVLGGAFAIGVGFGEYPAWAAPAPAPQDGNLGAWVHLAGDGTVTIQFALAEMGQGIMTTLPLILAEEMDADWALVRVAQSPCDGVAYGIKGAIKTFGSTATLANYQRFRLIGAQIRRQLLLTAAASLQVPAAELQTGAGRALHEKSGRTMSYGMLASQLRLPAVLPEITSADLKPPSRFRYLGKPVKRVDVPSKVDGSAMFGIDVRRPGMLYGAILRPPVQGETALSVDDSALRSQPGIVKIVHLPGGIGVIGDSVEATQAAKNALKVAWSNTAKAKDYSSASALSEYEAAVVQTSAQAATFLGKGDASAALTHAHATLAATYTADHAAHLCMEPMNATALVDGNQIELWAGTQAPTSIQVALSKLASVAPGNVHVHSTLLGGGFGRRFEVDYAVDAYLLAKEIPGRPVKLIYSREDDIRKDPYRPLVAQYVQVGLDEGGGIAAWHQRIAGESYFARTAPALLEKLAGNDPLVSGLGDIAYPVATQLMEYIRQDRGIAVGALRGTDAGYTIFAVESMIDEIAVHLGRDPLAYRLELLKNTPRAQAVLREAAAMSGWDRKRPGRGLGIAYSGDLSSFLAVAAEISLDPKTSGIIVHGIWAAFDAGQIMQPINLEAQLEGGLVFGLGLALTEQLNIKNGATVESNFSDYRVLRMSDMPEIEIRLIATQNPPGGAGEAGIPAIAPAIANALAQLTGGKRVRALPMLPGRVKAALAA
jgi:isoquinoline 1-oxidoreductase beta subunit